MEKEEVDWKLLLYYLSTSSVGGFIILMDVGSFIRLVAVSLLIFFCFSSSAHIITRKNKEDELMSGNCWKCGAKHGDYNSVKAALDVVMDSGNDGDCRMEARSWILKKV